MKLDGNLNINVGGGKENKIKGYLYKSLKTPVPMLIGIPIMMHSLTPEKVKQVL